MFETDSPDDEINLSYKSVTDFTKKEDVPLKLWAEHFSKPEKERNRNLTKIFEKELKYLKSLYCFLENDQVLGKTLTKFGIPNLCGKINKKFLKFSSKRSSKVNKFVRRNRTYLSKPCVPVLAKKINVKYVSSKVKHTATPQYPPVVERWSDTALKKNKSAQQSPTVQTYDFDNNHEFDKCKYKDATPSTSSVEKVQAELEIKSAFNTNNQKEEERIKDPSSLGAVVLKLNGPKGLVKKDDLKHVFKKCVRFNDDLCSFAPTQEYLTSESNSEIVFDEIVRDKSVSVLPGNAKTVTDQVIKTSTAEKIIAALSKTSSNFTLENDLQENTGISPIKPQQSDERENKIETHFEIEPYDNDNVVIEDFTESYSNSENGEENKKRRLPNTVANTNEAMKKYTLTTIDNVKVNKERNEEGFIPGDLNVRGTPPIFIQNLKLVEEADNSNFNISTNTSSQKHSIIYLSKGNTVNVIEATATVVPETPSSEEATDNKSCQSNALRVDSCQLAVPDISEEAEISKGIIQLHEKSVMIDRTPSPNTTVVDSRAFAFEKQSLNNLNSVENYAQKQQHSKQAKSSKHLLVEDWSDDEFIPMSPLQPQTQNENSEFSVTGDLNIKSIPKAATKNPKPADEANDRHNNISFSTSSQEQSSNSLKDNTLNVSDNKEVVVPETPTSEETTEAKYSSEVRQDSSQFPVLANTEGAEMSKGIVKSHENSTMLDKTPSPNKTVAVSGVLTFVNKSQNNSSTVEKHLQKERDILQTEIPTHELVEDWSDDEFIPMSPSQPTNHNENSINITAINGSIISSGKERNTTISCLTSSVLTLDEKHIKNAPYSSGMVSPCNSLSDREYISDSSQCDSEEELPTNETCRLSPECKLVNELKITEDFEVNTTSKNDFGVIIKNNETLISGSQNDIYFPSKSRDLSSLCTPSSEQHVGSNKDQTLFEVKAPSKMEKKTDSSTVDKLQVNASYDGNSESNLINHKTLSSLNPTQSLESENKVRKILFPLQTQPSVPAYQCEKGNEAQINNTQMLCTSYETINVNNVEEGKGIEETKIQSNEKCMVEGQKTGSCSFDPNLGSTNELHKLENEEESFGRLPISSQSNKGSVFYDATVTNNLPEYEVDNVDEVQYGNLQSVFCSQTKNEDSFSVCSSSQEEEIINISTPNDCSFMISEPSKDKNVLSNSSDKSENNKYQDLNKKVMSSDVNMPENNEGSCLFDSGVLSSKNKDVVLENKNISVEIDKSQCTPICNSTNSKIIKLQDDSKYVFEKKISTDTTLEYDNINKIMDKEESAMCDNNFNPDSSEKLDVSVDCDKMKSFHKETSFPTTDVPAQVCNEVNHVVEVECEVMEQETENNSNEKSLVTTTSGHSLHTSNQTTRSYITLTTVEMLPIPVIKLQLPTEQGVTFTESNTKHFEEDSSTMDIVKSSSTIKNDKFMTTTSIKLSDEKEHKENTKVVYENIYLPEDKFCKAKSPSFTSSVSLNTAHIPSRATHMTAISEFVKTIDSNTKVRHPLAVEPKLQTAQGVMSYAASTVESLKHRTQKKLKNDELRGLKFSEVTNLPQKPMKEVERTENKDTTQSGLNETSPVHKELSTTKNNLLSSNAILVSNKERSYNKSKLFCDAKEDDWQVKKSSNGLQFTTQSIAVTSWNNQNYKSTSDNVDKSPDHKPGSTQRAGSKESRKYKILKSDNTIKLQSQVPKLEITKEKLNSETNENCNKLKFNQSREHKSRSVFETTSFIPISNWQNVNQEMDSSHTRSIKEGVTKKSSQILTTENLFIPGNFSHNNQQHSRTNITVLKDSNKTRKNHTKNNITSYQSIPIIKILNNKQSVEEVNQQPQTQKHQQHNNASAKNQPQEMRLNGNEQWRRENSISCITSSINIRNKKFSKENLQKKENKLLSLIDDSPPVSNNKSFYLEEGTLDKQFSTSVKDRFKSIPTSDNESVQDFSGSLHHTNGSDSPLSSVESDVLLNAILNKNPKSDGNSGGSMGCTNGGFSPSSSISDMFLNGNLDNSFKSSTKQTKRKLLGNLYEITSDESDCGASPLKYRRTGTGNLITGLSNTKNCNFKYDKIVSSDGYVPSIHSDMSEQLNFENLSSDEESKLMGIYPSHGHRRRDMNYIDSSIPYDQANTIVADSPISTYDDDLNSDHHVSSPLCPDDYEVNDSSVYDRHCQSSESDRYLTDMFDD